MFLHFVYSSLKPTNILEGKSGTAAERGSGPPAKLSFPQIGTDGVASLATFLLFLLSPLHQAHINVPKPSGHRSGDNL